jgi:hypothetical protein
MKIGACQPKSNYMTDSWGNEKYVQFPNFLGGTLYYRPYAAQTLQVISG